MYRPMLHSIFVELFYLCNLFPCWRPQLCFAFLYYHWRLSFHPAVSIPTFLCPGIMLCAFLSLSAKEVVIGLVFFCGNYFCAIFRKSPLLTKFSIKAIATKIEKIMLSSTFSSHSLLGAGGQAIHDGPAFPGVFTISPCRQATSHCSATAQILS